MRLRLLQGLLSLVHPSRYCDNAAVRNHDSRNFASYAMRAAAQKKTTNWALVLVGCLLLELSSGRRDLNPRRRPWQGRTLPLSYSRKERRFLAWASRPVNKNYAGRFTLADWGVIARARMGRSVVPVVWEFICAGGLGPGPNRVSKQQSLEI